MNKIWDTIVNFMNLCWDKTLDFLSGLNAWIPLAAVLIAGIGLVVIVLVLALCGCAVRKCLIPHWLIWTYFAFAVIIIFAHTGNNLAAIVADIEIPFLIVLVCYILRALFRRRPRYTYVEKTVYARELAKGRVYCVNNDLTNNDAKNNESREIKRNNKKSKAEKEVKSLESHDEKVVENEIVPNEAEIAKREADAEAAKLAAAEQAAREAREQEKAQREAELAAREAEQAARENIRQESSRVDKNDFYNVRTTKTEVPQTTTTFTPVDLPNVQPIPDKTYEPTREPTIVTKPVSQRMPDLKIPNSTIQLRSSNAAVSRPSVTTTTMSAPNRTVSTQTRTTPTTTNTNAYTSMYNPRIVKTTTTTTTTNTDRLDAVTNSRTVNGNTTGSTTVKVTTNGATPNSTDDIMAAIERLRASMKK